MPIPHLSSSNGRDFHCSLCKKELRSAIHFPMGKPEIVRTEHGPSMEWPPEEESTLKNSKIKLLNEWDEHLRTTHPGQWQREQRKRTRRAKQAGFKEEPRSSE